MLRREEWVDIIAAHNRGVAIIAIIRISSMIIGYVRFRTTFTHTYLDRFAGVILFLFLPCVLLFNLDF